MRRNRHKNLCYQSPVHVRGNKFSIIALSRRHRGGRSYPFSAQIIQPTHLDEGRTVSLSMREHNFLLPLQCDSQRLDMTSHKPPQLLDYLRDSCKFSLFFFPALQISFSLESQTIGAIIGPVSVILKLSAFFAFLRKIKKKFRQRIKRTFLSLKYFLSSLQCKINDPHFSHHLVLLLNAFYLIRFARIISLLLSYTIQ